MKKLLFMKRILSATAIAALSTSLIHALPIGGMETKDSGNTHSYSRITLRSSPAYRLGGNYLWDQDKVNYGLELGYPNYPKNKYEITDPEKETYAGNYIDLIEANNYSFSDTGNGFYMLGKAGLARVNQTLRIVGTDMTSYDKTQEGVKPEVVVGAGYDFNKKLSLDLSYEHVFAGEEGPNGEAETNLTEISSVDTVLLGLTFHF